MWTGNSEWKLRLPILILSLPCPPRIKAQFRRHKKCSFQSLFQGKSQYSGQILEQTLEQTLEWTLERTLECTFFMSSKWRLRKRSQPHRIRVPLKCQKNVSLFFGWDTFLCPGNPEMTSMAKTLFLYYLQHPRINSFRLNSCIHKSPKESCWWADTSSKMMA